MIAAQKQKNQGRSFLRSFILWGPAEQYFRQTKIPRQKVPVRNISWELATSQKNGRDFVNEEEESVTAEELGTEVTLRQAMALPGAYTHPFEQASNSICKEHNSNWLSVAFSPPDMWGFVTTWGEPSTDE